jgi:very-short-patch-repair endonuclease
MGEILRDHGKQRCRSDGLAAHSARVQTILRKMAELASRTHGVISLAEARACGAEAMQLHRWVEAGWVDRIGRRNFTFPGQPMTWRLQLRAALNDAGSSAVASHASAAFLHCFDGAVEGAVELTVPRRNRGRQIDGILRSSRDLSKLDRCEVDGFAATSAARTIIDLAAVCNPTQLEAAVDSAMRKGQVSNDFLAKRVETLRGAGRRGIHKLDNVMVDTGGANALERRFLRLCREAQLPRPACQVTHRLGTQTIARVDFDFSPASLIVEVEGQIAHARPRQRQHDAERRRQLSRLGGLVYSFTYEDVFGRPDEVINDVRSALAASLGTKINNRV